MTTEPVDYTSYQYMPYTAKEWCKAYVRDRYDIEMTYDEWNYDEWQFPDGVIYCIDGGLAKWYKKINGKNLQHNINAPAEYFCKMGEICKIGWWYEGVEYSKKDYDKIMNFLAKRKRRLVRWVYEQWYSRFMRNPATSRGRKYIAKDYERMIEALQYEYSS